MDALPIKATRRHLIRHRLCRNEIGIHVTHKPDRVESVVREKCRQRKRAAMLLAPECCRPLGKGVGGDDKVGLIRPNDPSHRTHHHPSKGSTHRTPTRFLSRNVEEDIVEIRHKAQHRQINTLHEIVDDGHLSRHEVHDIDPLLRRSRLRLQCRANGLCRPRMPCTDGGGQNENAGMSHQPPPHTILF